MKALDEQDHYEILEIARAATAEEIERAYRMTSAAYADDSLALYSVFEADDAGVMRERIDLAFRVLSEGDRRREYDEQLAQRGGAAAHSTARHFSAESLAVEDGDLRTPSPPIPAMELPPSIEGFEDLETDGDDDYDGPSLRRARLNRGIEIDQISTVTKISSTHLRFLEEDCYDELPAPVYVRGFVSAYARSIGLDPQRVVAGYMAHLEVVRGGQRRSRPLGRA